MDNAEIHRTISELVSEEKRLRGEPTHTDEQRGRLRQLEESLDQCWDLLRQRRARRNAGQDPDSATLRPERVVEGYQQ